MLEHIAFLVESPAMKFYTMPWDIFQNVLYVYSKDAALNLF